MPSYLPLALAGVTFALSACVGPGAPATPQRPTFSSSTATTAHGTVELEAGVAVDPGDALDTPLALKGGISPTSELFVGFSPWRRIEQVGSDPDGPGDVVVGMRQRVVEDDPSFAIQLTAKLPTTSGARGLGTGQVDAFFAGILTTGPWTAFYQPGLLGEPGGGTEVEHGLAVAFGPEVAEGWYAIGELAAQLRPESSYESVFATIGAARAIDPSLVLDASVVAGLSEDAPDFVFQIGFTKNFGPNSN